MRRKLPDLSTTQVIASGVATAVAAIGASFLGVYGTVIGTALMSVISTAGAAVCKHYLDRGRDQIRDMSHVQGAARRREAADDAGEEATSADPTRTMVWPAGTDPSRTMVSPPGGDPSATRLDGGLGDPNATRLDSPPGDPSATRADPSRTVAGALAAEAGEDARRRVARRTALDETLAWAKQNWAKLAASSAVVFAVVLGGITIYEATTGAPLGGSGGGLTVTKVLGGGDGGSGGTVEETPTDAPTGDGHGTAPAESPGESPTGEASTGTPDGPGDGSGATPTGDATTGPSGGGGDPTGEPTDGPTGERPTTSGPEAPGTPAPTGSSGGGQEQQGGTDVQQRGDTAD
ncbi:hypothetical protein [Actinomadura sp. WMMB 499]|uniref:hypothetical protein n=1 Tax=Actinomadura sp. WMMB 499 TaxID=1219491 RepID=UPI001247B01B|nr:hypothetical protein [Actinomadura sp. WMMB 499]QFG20879.1 hypothetical protein F7P10_06725 [Actinomadura sp. WMMB 499]